MKIEAVYYPSFKFTLTEETIDLLIEMGSLHYDNECKWASKGLSDGFPTNGFLYVLKHFREPEEPAIYKNGEVQIILKIMEIMPALSPDTFEPVQWVLLDDLQFSLHKALRVAEAKTEVLVD